MKSLLVIPTYNECNNISQLVPAIWAQVPDVDILIVDDNSPDGTGRLVADMAAHSPRLHLLSRDKKSGLGTAYVAGFRWGLTRGFDQLIEMDADFSHRPLDLTGLLQSLAHADFAIGSRYTCGGKIVHWGRIRTWLSRWGSCYARWILGYPLQDWTGGFNAWTRRVLEEVDLSAVRSEGYSFQIELKYRALRLGFTGIEVPITFEERRAGQSKMSLRIVLEALYRVWLLRMRVADPRWLEGEATRCRGKAYKALFYPRRGG